MIEQTEQPVVKGPLVKGIDPAGSFSLPGTSLTLNRMGYGAMQLSGPGISLLPPRRGISARQSLLAIPVDRNRPVHRPRAGRVRCLLLVDQAAHSLTTGVTRRWALRPSVTIACS